MIIVLTFD